MAGGEDAGDVEVAPVPEDTPDVRDTATAEDGSLNAEVDGAGELADVSGVRELEESPPLLGSKELLGGADESWEIPEPEVCCT